MKLSKREKYSVSLAIMFVCIFGIMQFIVLPFNKEKERLGKRRTAKIKMLEEMKYLNAEYDTLVNNTGSWEKRLKERPKGFTLFSFLDRLAGEAQIKENVAYMKPSKSDQKNSPYKLSLVEMKIQGINLKRLTPYLHKIENSQYNIFIKKMLILKKGKEEGLIDTILQVETFET